MPEQPQSRTIGSQPSAQADERIAQGTTMTLQELLDRARCGPGEMPVTKGFYFPLTIELPAALQVYLANTWAASEAKRQEIGGNLRFDAADRMFTPRNAVRSPAAFGRPRSASSPPDLSHAAAFTPIDVADGVGGNSVEIVPRTDANVVANFHTHPSTPGGTNAEHCGYQPPSIEDVLAMKVQADQWRDIFVSLVAAHKSEVYAMVYVRGISQFNGESLKKVQFYADTLYTQGKRIKFPSDKDEEAYWSQVAKQPERKSAIEAALEQRTIYGEKLSALIWDHLNQVCHVLGIALYRGDGAILRLMNY